MPHDYFLAKKRGKWVRGALTKRGKWIKNGLEARQQGLKERGERVRGTLLSNEKKKKEQKNRQKIVWRHVSKEGKKIREEKGEKKQI